MANPISFGIGEKVKSPWVGIFFERLRAGQTKQQVSRYDSTAIRFFDVDIGAEFAVNDA